MTPRGPGATVRQGNELRVARVQGGSRAAARAGSAFRACTELEAVLARSIGCLHAQAFCRPCNGHTHTHTHTNTHTPLTASPQTTCARAESNTDDCALRNVTAAQLGGNDFDINPTAVNRTLPLILSNTTGRSILEVGDVPRASEGPPRNRLVC